LSSRTDLPIISEELKTYIFDLLGEDIAQQYLLALPTPMEDYTLHIFRNYELVNDLLPLLRKKGFIAEVHKDFSNIIKIIPRGPFSLGDLDEYKEIIVDTRASEMIYQGADIFVPGVKRANKVEKGDLVKVISPFNIQVAKAKATMSHNEMLLNKRGVAAKNLLSPYQVPSVPQLDIAHLPVFFQSLPAYLASLNLSPKTGEVILDCCAAPGNKTIHLSELSKEKAKIIAIDRSKNRLQKLIEKINRFKIRNIIPVTGNIVKLSNEWTAKFDKILVDPPCTALGLRPRLHLNEKIKTIQETARYQRAILRACANLLKSGGNMIYSTCTITKEENEDVIEFALSELGLEVIEQEFKIAKMSAITTDSELHVQRFIPGIDKTIGFFIAKLQKKV